MYVRRCATRLMANDGWKEMLQIRRAGNSLPDVLPTGPRGWWICAAA